MVSPTARPKCEQAVKNGPGLRIFPPPPSPAPLPRCRLLPSLRKAGQSVASFTVPPSSSSHPKPSPEPSLASWRTGATLNAPRASQTAPPGWIGPRPWSVCTFHRFNLASARLFSTFPPTIHQVRPPSTCSPSPFRRTPPPLALRLRLHHATGTPRPRARALATLYWAIKNFCPSRGVY